MTTARTPPVLAGRVRWCRRESRTAVDLYDADDELDAENDRDREEVGPGQTTTWIPATMARAPYATMPRHARRPVLAGLGHVDCPDHQLRDHPDRQQPHDHLDRHENAGELRQRAMSPNPTNTVTVKYRASVRLSGSLKARAWPASMRQ